MRTRAFWFRASSTPLNNTASHHLLTSSNYQVTLPDSSGGPPTMSNPHDSKAVVYFTYAHLELGINISNGNVLTLHRCPKPEDLAESRVNSAAVLIWRHLEQRLVLEVSAPLPRGRWGCCSSTPDSGWSCTQCRQLASLKHLHDIIQDLPAVACMRSCRILRQLHATAVHMHRWS